MTGQNPCSITLTIYFEIYNLEKYYCNQLFDYLGQMVKSDDKHFSISNHAIIKQNEYSIYCNHLPVTCIKHKIMKCYIDI